MTRRKQLLDGISEAANHLEALAQDYGTESDPERRALVPGISLAADMLHEIARGKRSLPRIQVDFTDSYEEEE